MNGVSVNFAGVHIAVSDFDGVHKGHQELLRHRTALVLPSPRPCLTTEDEKISLLKEQGAATIILGNYQSPEEAIAYAAGAASIATEPNPDIGQRIKALLAAGEISAANKLLGRPYAITGKIVHGKALGRRVSMPTANLSPPPEKLLPMEGVYASLLEVDGKEYQGVTNIGQRPSVDNCRDITVETHILNFNRDIYGLQVKLKLQGFIRGVRRFTSLNEVKAQVDLDILEAEKIFGVFQNMLTK